jgi:hypothetical protein
MQLNVFEGKEGANAVENIYPCERSEGVCTSGDIDPPTHSHGTGQRWVLGFMSRHLSCQGKSLCTQ